MSWFLRTTVVVLALAAATVSTPAAWIEQAYTRGLFPPVQRLVTRASNLTTLALLDLLILAASACWIIFVVRDIARRRQFGWLGVLKATGVRTVTFAAVVYLGFLGLWGFNYRRIPLEEKLQFNATRVSPATALELLRLSITRLNELHEVAHRGAWHQPDRIDPELAQAFARALGELDVTPGTVPGRPKRTLLDPYFLRAGVAGMTDPFFLETLIASDLLTIERPFVIAHEWSHLAGFADEREANFAGWLTTMRGTPFHQYSGWLFLYGELVSALKPSDARVEMRNLTAGPVADLTAIRDRLQRNVNPRVSAAGWRVYDEYLKANRIEEGAASYAEVVTLILGTEFGENWTPKLRR